MYSRIVYGTACSGNRFFWGGGRHNRTWAVKGKSSQPPGGVGPTSGSVPEKRAAGERMVCGTGRSSTYYNWQRKVFQSAVSEDEVYFVEVPVRPATTETAACVQWGELRGDIHAGADLETIRAIIQTLKLC